MSQAIVDWDKPKKDFYRIVGGIAMKALTANGFHAEYVETREDAVREVLSLVPEGASVGVPGSVTVRELGLIERLEERGCRIAHHWDPVLGAEERQQRFAEELESDVYLTSSNAVTLDGKLVNIDGTGNRVAGMAWAKNRICLVVGINKVCRDVESALQRIRDVATPMNNIRLGLVHLPCVQAGYCVDCKVPQRSCRVVTVMERAPFGRDAHVILVGESLGF